MHTPNGDDKDFCLFHIGAHARRNIVVKLKKQFRVQLIKRISILPKNSILRISDS